MTLLATFSVFRMALSKENHNSVLCVYIDGLLLRLREPIVGLVMCMWEHLPMQTILLCSFLPQIELCAQIKSCRFVKSTVESLV